MNVSETNQLFFTLRKTSFGPAVVLWAIHQDRPRIYRVLLSKPGKTADRIVRSDFQNVRRSSCDEIDNVANRIVAFLSGEKIRFSLDIARMDLCSPFKQKVLRAEHGIPRGQVSTYQRIARHIGDRNAARAVGTALATNPFPIIIPCHRAIRSDGNLGGYQGGLDMKRTLLTMEGIHFDDSGRIAIGKLYY